MENKPVNHAGQPQGFVSGKIPLTLRLEAPADYRAIEEITRDAFWREDVDEHYLVHILRKHPDFIPELDFVAETESGRLIGNIMYSKAEIRSADGTAYPVITFGPLTVAPEFQRRGVGQALMSRSIEEAKRLKYRAIVFFGHPDYYPRQGFRRGADFEITAGDGSSFDALMAMPLYQGALDGVSGCFHESEAFQMNPLAVAEFEKGFYQKSFPVLPPISLLFPLLPNEARAPLAAKGMHTLTDLSRISGRELLEIIGISREALADINGVLRQYGLPEKRLPEDSIFYKEIAFMTIQEIKEAWYASIYDQQLNDTDDVNAILETLGPLPQRVLEAACGTGRILLPLAKAGHLAEGFDLARAEIARCTEKLQPYPNARCYSMDGLEQDWGTGFDAVVLSGNLLINLVTQEDYTFAQQEFLRRAAKALRPGGHLFLSFDCFDRPAVEPDSMEEIIIFSGTDERGTLGKFILVPTANGYDPVTRVDISPRRYEITPKNGALQVFEEMRKKHFPTLAEVHGWLQAAGLKIEWEYGGFDRRPMDEAAPGNTAVIWAVK